MTKKMVERPYCASGNCESEWGKINVKEEQRYSPGTLILSEHFRLYPDDRQSAFHVMMVGGAGSGKTFYGILPNLLQADCSYVITDTNAVQYRRLAPLYKKLGYQVRCLDLDQFHNTTAYNPLAYIKGDRDIETLVDTIMMNTKPAADHGDDESYPQEDCTSCLLRALLAFLCYEYKDMPEKQNLSYLFQLIQEAANEKDTDQTPHIASLFRNLEQKKPECYAIQQYKTFRLSAGNKCVTAYKAAADRLRIFQLEPVAMMTKTDHMHLERVNQEKTAIFINLTNDPNFEMLSAMFYTQVMAQLQYSEEVPDYPVICAMDELQSTGYIPDFVKRIHHGAKDGRFSTICCVQDMRQLNKLYSKDVDAIISSCNALVLLNNGYHSHMRRLIRQWTDTKPMQVVLGRFKEHKCLVLLKGRKLQADNVYPTERHPSNENK